MSSTIHKTPSKPRKRLRAYLKSSVRASRRARWAAACLGAGLGLLFCLIKPWLPLPTAYIDPLRIQLNENVLHYTVPYVLGGVITSLTILRGLVLGWPRSLSGLVGFECGLYVTMFCATVPAVGGILVLIYPYSLLVALLSALSYAVVAHLYLVLGWLGLWALASTTTNVVLLSRWLRAKPEWILSWPGATGTRGITNSPRAIDPPRKRLGSST